MHTIEHVGLGRYGDPLDPEGDLKAISELKRVLKPGGDLLFVTPVGKPTIAFNAHRIYSYEQVRDFFSPLELKEFSLVPDSGGLLVNADPALVAAQAYGCGCFWFRKPQ
jgi:SAM-dependent methyltransferase